ncbi:synaptotagmin-1-like [Terrapene carolina triunguis]|uniref:synaptotagmin-1-like n=1 Tax=Terrapene triunguis TaxID=2587831 RepID=UPI000E77D342|nr:synaptotagmin-1-like [Terrapene carolina triunguis]
MCVWDFFGVVQFVVIQEITCQCTSAKERQCDLVVKDWVETHETWVLVMALSPSCCVTLSQGDDTRELHSASLAEFTAALSRHLEVWDFGISHPPGFGGSNHFNLPNAPVPETEKIWEKCHLQAAALIFAVVPTEKKYLSEACKDTKAENGILGDKLRPALLDIAKQSLLDVKIQKLQEELDKLGTCLSPSCTSSKNLESVGSNADFLESSRGRLRFSLFYHRERLELLLTVIAVTGLPSRGSADSAVRVRLLKQVPSHISGLQCMVHEWQTQAVKNCRKPAFGDQFVCSLQEAELEKSTVKLEVKHYNKYSRHTMLGEVRVTLSKLKASQRMEFCEELQKTTKDLVGEVLVSLKCLPISQKIEIGLLKVKTASVCSSPEKSVYARIDISCNLHKQKHQKSSPRARTSVIIFNETFLFHLAEPVAGACTVLVSIYEMNSRARGSNRQLIGQAVLGKRSPSEANDHWALMMQSVQQPVAKWHPLLL